MRLIYLIRHGVPAQLGEKRYIGTTDLPLSEVGKEQMEMIREFLATKNITRIYHSPLSRCKVGAEVISRGRIPIVNHLDLHEIHMGDWENTSFSVIKDRYPQLYQQRGEEIDKFTPPNGESFDQCLERSKKAWQEILQNSEGDIAVVAHAGVNRTLICWMQNRPVKELFMIKQPYGCINLIQQIEKGFRVIYTGKVLEY